MGEINKLTYPNDLKIFGTSTSGFFSRIDL